MMFYADCCSFDLHHDPTIEIENEIEDLDDLLYDVKKMQFYNDPAPPEKHLKKAVRAYDQRKYRRCLEYIKEYEKALEKDGANPPYYYNQLTKEQKVLIYSYKAYCKKCLKSYESAQEYFVNLIDLMKDEGYRPECLFMIYWQHASCYYFLGQKEKCADRIRKLVNMEIGPTIRELKENNYRINRQPCFHEQELVKGDKMVINEIIATTLGKEIVALEGEFTPTICTCTDEDSSFCADWCTRIGSYATVACAFIPNKFAQAITLFALVEFAVECEKCCEKGLGHENCCRKLKKAIQYAFDQERLNEI
jgi:tetratricopeptide (TPR) repeat protein